VGGFESLPNAETLAVDAQLFAHLQVASLLLVTAMLTPDSQDPDFVVKEV